MDRPHSLATGDAPEADGAHRADAAHWFAEGNLHLAAGDRGPAEACFRHAMSLDPGMAEAHANLGWVMAEQGQADEADRFYRQALVRSASHVPIRLNYGAFLARLKRFDAAERVYLGALDRDLGSPQVWSNLGALYAQMERFDEAEACCRRSAALDPGYVNARINLAYLCLRRGAFAEGWAHYAWRGWQARLFDQATCPRWDGAPLAGRSIVIGHEAGLGDAIQFCRYVAVLKARGARHVTLVCPTPLRALFASLEGVDEVLDRAEPLGPPRWDTWASLMSLPQLCDTRLETIPAPLPYLRADPAEVDRWRARLRPPTQRLRVGLAWRGNPTFENDADRSLPSLALLNGLFAAAGMDLVSLQKDATPAESAVLAAAGARDPMAEVDTFATTAAIVSTLDLVISVDTAVAHLAGALGVRCWVLLPRHMTDWRWLDGREDTPWYPGTMRLFKQARAGDWTAPIAAVTEGVEGLAREHRCPPVVSG